MFTWLMFVYYGPIIFRWLRERFYFRKDHAKSEDDIPLWRRCVLGFFLYCETTSAAAIFYFFEFPFQFTMSTAVRTPERASGRLGSTVSGTCFKFQQHTIHYRYCGRDRNYQPDPGHRMMCLFWLPSYTGSIIQTYSWVLSGYTNLSGQA